MGQFNLLLKGSALRTVEAIVSIVVGFITLPLMNSYLGTELYGLWVLVGSVTAMMYIFDFGFASAVIQRISYSIGQKDHVKANSIISTALAIYSCLAGLIAAFVVLGVMMYTPNIKETIDETDFKLVLLLVGFAIAIEFPAKAFAGLAAAHFRHDLVSLSRIIFKLASTAALVVLLLNGQKIVAIAISHFVFSVLSALAFVAVGRYAYKEMSLSWSGVSKTSFKELFSFSLWAFLIDMMQALKSRIDLFFIGAYISLAAVTVYYVSVRLVDYTVELLYKALGITLPTFTAHAAKGDVSQHREDLLLFNRINTYAYTLVIMFYTMLGKTIIYYWLGKDFDYETGYIILLILAVGRVSALVVDGYVTSLYAKNLHKVLILTGIFETIATAILLYIFLAVLGYGPIYAAISISAPILLSRLIFIPSLCRKKFDMDAYGKLVVLSYRPLLFVVIGVTIHVMFHVGEAPISYKLLFEVLSIVMIFLIFMYFEMQEREKYLLGKIYKGGIRLVKKKILGEKSGAN